MVILRAARPSVPPPRPPCLTPLTHRALQGRLRRRPRLVVPTRLKDRADQALDAEPGVLPSAIVHRGPGPGQGTITLRGSLDLAPDDHEAHLGVPRRVRLWQPRR